MENVFEIRDLTKKYAEILAVNYISFDVKKRDLQSLRAK